MSNCVNLLEGEQRKGEERKGEYVIINCNEESCDNIDGFPYIIHPDGEISIGYTEF